MKNDSRLRQSGGRVRQTGVTLIEMMVVVVILAIIVAFAYPSYAQFIVRAKRSAGKSMLLQVADRQQQFFMDNKRYSGSLMALGFPADTFMIGDEGAFLADGDADRV
ncbi:MAG: type IV pilin protein, partial [Pseudomonadota bacterium]